MDVAFRLAGLLLLLVNSVTSNDEFNTSGELTLPPSPSLSLSLSLYFLLICIPLSYLLRARQLFIESVSGI